MRRPLRVLTAAARAALQAALGVDSENLPLGLTEAERKAALRPPEEKRMEPKAGYKTTEFWLTAVVTIAVLPFLGWLVADTGPLPAILDELAAKGGTFGVIVGLVKLPVLGFLGWVLKKLTERFIDSRTELKKLAGAPTPPAS